MMVPAWFPEKRRLIASTTLALGGILLVGIAILVLRWPFRRAAVVRELETASLTKVQVGGFHETYFPRPGCVLEQVIFQHNPQPGSQPLITIQRMRVESSFSSLFRSKVKRVLAEGVRILIPALGSEHFETPARSNVVIDNLIADGAVLEVARSAGEPPLKFSFHNFLLRDVGSRGPASFQAKLSNPEPPGEITTAGKFGPWNPDVVGKTAVAGDYLFEQADLGVFPGISGLLTSSGKFSGVLGRIEVQGTTNTPSFRVTSSTHQAPLETQFHAIVNGENGDTLLEKVAATFGKTTIWSDGSVEGKTGQSGKTTSVELATKQGRIQDLLLLFAQSKRSPMSGTVSFRAQVTIPPGTEPFLNKVELQGDFGVDAGSFTNTGTQEGINHLSQGALGEKKSSPTEKDEPAPETVLSDLKGHVMLKHGTATFSSLSFSVPGASAEMRGTYSLISEKVDLRGTLKTNSEVAKTTSGMKSAMLKVLQPFFKKKPSGYVAPVKITGTYEHPSFGLDWGDGDNHKQRDRATNATQFPASRR
jgi:hypothetical protein